MVGVGGCGGEGWWWGGVGLPPIQPFRIRDDLSSYDRVGGGGGTVYPGGIQYIPGKKMH